MFRLFDFICTKCQDEDGNDFIFEDLVQVMDPNEATAKCPKCGAVCHRTVNQKGPPKHLSWAMWRAKLSD